MSSEIIYKENRINNVKDENIYMKSDKGRSVIRETSAFPKEQKFLSVQRLIFLIRSVFLPQGFPQSVHPDYVPYQIWDTVQAFASTILGTLTTHSILIGVGVGESTATPLAATISWILKDGAGMIGRILFAWWNGSQLDAQCKKWRIFADVLNDIAMGIELLLPYFSTTYTTLILCATTSMKSIVGVAGGATRAALTQHQALNNNLADVSAKDGSQETFVNLVASFVGIFILNSLHNSVSGGFLLYVTLVIVHVYANYSAVRSLRFNSLNEDRLALVLDNYAKCGRILGVEECNKRESLLLFQKPWWKQEINLLPIGEWRARWDL
ncbi:RUS1 family protein C16orf58 homolog isoform X2 [Diachasma alloeum]|uniref:RUS1 family protein C16orf58 homolog isoform X2 n=1 Tax=Diachasma alloeum TaxID=454923 RepID=UPI0007381D55|nr:RUS1 family protein C16orf58 homolog isoform X2 [Diachasma alloeum]